MTKVNASRYSLLGSFQHLEDLADSYTLTNCPEMKPEIEGSRCSYRISVEAADVKIKDGRCRSHPVIFKIRVVMGIVGSAKPGGHSGSVVGRFRLIILRVHGY